MAHASHGKARRLELPTQATHAHRRVLAGWRPLAKTGLLPGEPVRRELVVAERKEKQKMQSDY